MKAEAAPPAPSASRAAAIRRMATATVVPLFFLAAPFPFGLAEAAASLVDGAARFSLARVAFVVTMALVPPVMGALATQLARPHPVGGPAVFTAAFLAVWGAILVRREGGFAFFLYFAVTVPGYLLGVVGWAWILARFDRFGERSPDGPDTG